MTSYIFTGPWINYDRNIVLGATLTLSQRDANFLTAFLGIFIVFVGSAFWNIFTFILYNIIDRDGKVDILRRQHQVILRNSEDALAASWQFLNVPLAWKKIYFRVDNGRNRIHSFWKYTLRSLALAIWGLVIFSAFTVAGIFSSETSTSAGTETLIRSENCGSWTFPVSNSSLVVGLPSKLLSDSTLAASYVDRCYGPNATSRLCQSFVKQAISFSNRTNASCPFAAGWCWYNDSAALELDTGYIDSDKDLGINAPPSDRIQYRRVTTCSVIPENPDYITLTNSTTGIFSRYWYGPALGADTNWTFEYNHVETTLPIGYELNVDFATMGSETVSWIPNQQLNTTQVPGDITLIYLAPNSIVYTEPINDPFYAAHRRSSTVSVNGFEFTPYLSDYYVHMIGCIDQHQFCNPNRRSDSTANCTICTGAIPLANSQETIGYNARQLATANRIRNILLNHGVIGRSIFGRGNSALQANKVVFAGGGGASLQNALPDDQWVLEITNWFTVGLAQLQRAVVEFAAGPVNLPPGGQVITPTYEGWPIMCKRQKVHNPGEYQNFSILALSIIIGVGAIIIFLSLTIEPIINHFRKRQAPFKRLRWVLDNKLQLQRMAYQYINLGEWARKDKEVPVMVPMDDKIFALPKNIDYCNPGLSEHHDICNLEDRTFGTSIHQKERMYPRQ